MGEHYIQWELAKIKQRRWLDEAAHDRLAAEFSVPETAPVVRRSRPAAWLYAMITLLHRLVG